MLYKKPEIKSYSAGDIIEEIGPCQNQYTTTIFYTTTGNTSVNVDGWIIDSGFVGANGEYSMSVGLGDSDGNDVIRGFSGFDISSIQGRTIVSATLRLYQAAVLGTPYADLGTMVVDHINFGSSLDAGDFNSAALTSNIGTLSTNTTYEWKTLDVTSYVQADLNASRTSSQFRVYFTINTGGGGDWDAVAFEDVENTRSSGTDKKPQLVVTYK